MKRKYVWVIYKQRQYENERYHMVDRTFTSKRAAEEFIDKFDLEILDPLVLKLFLPKRKKK